MDKNYWFAFVVSYGLLQCAPAVENSGGKWHESKPHTFSINTKTLIQALSEFAQQSDVQILLPHDALQGLKGRNLSGNFTAAQALDSLLLGTGFEAVWLNAGSVAIRKIEVTQNDDAENDLLTDNLELLEPEDIVVITGFRRALSSSLAEKRIAETVSDVISQESIAKLPDRNVAQALQRLPGITIDRGEFISIRGADPSLNLVELNGHTLGTGTLTNRDVSFTIFGTELFKHLKVIKTPIASMDEGGLGGTIQLETIQPLDLAENISGLELGSALQTASGRWGREYKLLSGRAFEEFEIAGYFLLSMQEEVQKIDALEHDDWAAVTPMLLNNSSADSELIGAEYPERVFVSRSYQHKERRNFLGIAQWQLNDDWTLSADIFHTNLSPKTDEFSLRSTLNGDASLLSGVRDSNWLTQGNFSSASLLSRTRLDQASQYQIGKHLSAELSTSGWDVAIHVRESKTQQSNDIIDAFGSSELAASLGVSSSLGFSDIVVSGPEIFDENQWQYRPLRVRQVSVTDEEGSLQADFLRYLPSEFTDSVQFGVKLRSRDKVLSRQADNLDIPGSFSDYAFPFFMNDYLSSLDVRSSLTGWPRLNYEAMLQAAPPVEPDTESELPDSIIKEDKLALYAFLRVKGELVSRPFSGNIGLRYVDTKTHAEQKTRVIEPDGLALFTQSFIENNYRIVLPSLNLNLDLPNDKVIRLAVAKVLAEPGIGSLRADLTRDHESAYLRVGNSELLPYLALQYDVSYENYFAEEGLFSATLFYKDFSSYIERTSQTQLIDIGFGEQFYTIERDVNGGSAKLSGIEMSLQTPFVFLANPWNSFGIMANITRTRSQRTWLTGLESALPGQADFTSNFVLYYDRNDFSARLAHSFRSAALSTQSGNESFNRFEASRHQVDFGLRYRVSGRVTVSLDAFNLTNTPYHQYIGTVRRLEAYGVREQSVYLGIGVEW